MTIAGERLRHRTHLLNKEPRERAERPVSWCDDFYRGARMGQCDRQRLASALLAGPVQSQRRMNTQKVSCLQKSVLEISRICHSRRLWERQARTTESLRSQAPKERVRWFQRPRLIEQIGKSDRSPARQRICSRGNHDERVVE